MAEDMLYNHIVSPNDVHYPYALIELLTLM
jgi:hypothetical protein